MDICCSLFHLSQFKLNPMLFFFLNNELALYLQYIMYIYCIFYYLKIMRSLLQL